VDVEDLVELRPEAGVPTQHPLVAVE